MPPATLRQKRSKETRQLILDTAYRSFATVGYGQTTVDALITAAGLSKGAFYHHFDCKEAVFNALLEARIRDCAERMTVAVGSGRSLRDAVQGLARVGIQTLVEDPNWIRLYMEFWLQARRDPFARDIVVRSMAQCRELIARMLRMGQDGGMVRSDLDPDAAAAILSGVFDGVALQAEIDPDAVNLDRMIEPIADLIQRFIESPTESSRPETRRKP